MRRQPRDDGARDHLRLAQAEGVGPVAYRRLMRRYGSPTAALAALPELARAGGRADPLAIPSTSEAERELDRLARLGGRMLVLDQPDYPPLLALLDDAPPVLFVLGDPAVLTCRAVALVGGRNASANGLRIAETLAAELAGAGLVVVSGLARGIDAAAHEGALGACPEGDRPLTARTAAVVAGGLDEPYPPEHADLQRRIAETGAVVSEAPLGTVPQSRHFPRRNRVIAGLSLGVVVIEAAPRSGSLITARLAQEAGRELFAVPGSPLDPRARGSNDLIREGAHLTESAADVLANLPDHPLRQGLGRDPLFAGQMPPGLAEPPAPAPEPWNDHPETPKDLAQVRARVVDLLGPSPTVVDDLVRRCQFSAAAVMAALLELELAGRIETLPGHRVALLSRHSPF
jgi:DNA processing protein